MGTIDREIDRELDGTDDRHGSITVPAKLEHLDDIYDLVHAALSKAGCPPAVRNQLDVVLEEVFVNVCSYAYAGQDEVGLCRLEYACRTDPSSIVIRVTDWGIPFDPLVHVDPESPTSIEDAPIGGLGIMMVKRMTDRISYMHAAGANVLTFKKDW